MKKLSNNFIIIFIAILGLIFSIIGATFAYFNIDVNNNTVIGGSTHNFDISLTLTSLKVGNLVPLRSSLIDQTMNSNNKCIDLNNNDICSYYQVTLTNNGSAETLSGYIKTETSNNPYTTDHLHFKLYNSSYIAVSGESIISPTVDSKNYLKTTTGDTNLNISVPNGSSTYYLAVWLNDSDNANQLEDVNKRFVGSLEFVSTNGENVLAQFES